MNRVRIDLRSEKDRHCVGFDLVGPNYNEKNLARSSSIMVQLLVL